jgi:hypothetical protein
MTYPVNSSGRAGDPRPFTLGRQGSTGEGDGPPVAQAGTWALRRELTVRPWSLARERLIIGAHLRHMGWADVAGPAVLCVTELLSNVLKHVGSGKCGLHLQSSPARVRISVSDDSEQLPIVCTPDWSSESGRGLFLLSRTADSWGVDPIREGKVVWVEFHGTQVLTFACSHQQSRIIQETV